MKMMWKKIGKTNTTCRATTSNFFPPPNATRVLSIAIFMFDQAPGTRVPRGLIRKSNELFPLNLILLLDFDTGVYNR